jgi:hypothetical protein
VLGAVGLLASCIWLMVVAFNMWQLRHTTSAEKLAAKNEIA